MYLADYHIHSRISPDAATSMKDLAEAGIAAGLDELCFTDHLEPLCWGSEELRTSYDWAALTAEFAEAKAAVGDRIRLRLGIELGDAFCSFSRTEELMATAPELDFVIGSVHLIGTNGGNQDLYFFDPTNEQEIRLGILDYLDRVRQMANWGRFTVLGHLTLPLRYLNEIKGHHATFDGYEAEVEEIFRILIDRGLGIELNTNRGNTPLPDGKWLRMYRELGGEIITLGTDAHDAHYLGCAVRERQALLKECGFKRFCTFERQKPLWHEL